jgi:hypothetical protein
MSGTEGFSMQAPTLSEEAFDKIFEAENKRMMGDATLHKELGRNGYPEPVVVQTTIPEAQEQEPEVPVVEAEPEPSQEVEAGATDGGSTPQEAPATTEQQEDALAWLASLEPSVKARVEEALAEKAKLEHKLKSDEGRVAAYQRHYDQARQELEALKRGAQQTKPPAQQPAANQQQKKEVPAEIQAILETDETLGKALLRQWEEGQRREEALLSKIEAVEKETIQPLREQQQELYLRNELELLEQEMTGAKAVLAHDIWEDFKSVAPPWLKALAQSSKRQEVATALQEYQRWISDPEVAKWATAKYGAAETQQAEPKPQAQAAARQPDPQAVAKAEAAKATAERKSKASPVSPASAARTTAKELTFDEALKDPKLMEKWHQVQFEKELAKIEGRKS